MKSSISKNILENLILNCITQYKLTFDQVYLYRFFELTHSVVFDLIYNDIKDEKLSSNYTQKIYQNLADKLIMYDHTTDVISWLKDLLHKELPAIKSAHPTYSKMA